MQDDIWHENNEMEKAYNLCTYKERFLNSFYEFRKNKHKPLISINMYQNIAKFSQCLAGLRGHKYYTNELDVEQIFNCLKYSKYRKQTFFNLFFYQKCQTFKTEQELENFINSFIYTF